LHVTHGYNTYQMSRNTCRPNRAKLGLRVSNMNSKASKLLSPSSLQQCK
jgi:hypothetical protein